MDLLVLTDSSFAIIIAILQKHRAGGKCPSGRRESDPSSSDVEIKSRRALCHLFSSTERDLEGGDDTRWAAPTRSGGPLAAHHFHFYAPHLTDKQGRGSER